MVPFLSFQEVKEGEKEGRRMQEQESIGGCWGILATLFVSPMFILTNLDNILELPICPSKKKCSQCLIASDAAKLFRNVGSFSGEISRVQWIALLCPSFLLF